MDIACGRIMPCCWLSFQHPPQFLQKIVVKDIDSNLATAIRTSIILLLTWGNCDDMEMIYYQ